LEGDNAGRGGAGSQSARAALADFSGFRPLPSRGRQHGGRSHSPERWTSSFSSQMQGRRRLKDYMRAVPAISGDPAAHGLPGQQPGDGREGVLCSVRKSPPFFPPPPTALGTTPVGIPRPNDLNGRQDIVAGQKGRAVLQLSAPRGAFTGELRANFRPSARGPKLPPPSSCLNKRNNLAGPVRGGGGGPWDPKTADIGPRTPPFGGVGTRHVRALARRPYCPPGPSLPPNPSFAPGSID